MRFVVSNRHWLIDAAIASSKRIRVIGDHHTLNQESPASRSHSFLACCQHLRPSPQEGDSCTPALVKRRLNEGDKCSW